MSLELIVDTEAVRLYHGDSQDYSLEDIDLVLTNPYAPLPTQLRNKPMMLSNFADRKATVETWCGNPLHEIGRWGVDGKQAVWVANMEPKPIDLSFIGQEEFTRGCAWWPLDLPLRLIEHCEIWRTQTHEGVRLRFPVRTVWDGFCGRGTTGKACQIHVLAFVGVDIDIQRIELARKYLGV